MRVLDLFSGLGGWSAPARDRGHAVVRVELEPSLEAEVHADIATLTAESLGGRGAYDLVLASPPCEGFSVMNIGRNWHGPGCEAECRDAGREHVDAAPKTDAARHALVLVTAARRLIAELDPPMWVMENPVGKLRVLPVVGDLERRTVSYCHYGERRMKPTDLWSDRWPSTLELEPRCHNTMSGHPDDCCCRDHSPAPRGSTTGTQGYGDYWQKSVVPYALASAVTDAAERDHAARNRAWIMEGTLR